MTVGARRLELDGSAVKRHGCAQLARVAQCVAEVIQRRHVPRAQAQHSLVERHRHRPSPHLLQGIGGRQEHLLVIGPQLKRALEAHERFRPLPVIMQREPEIAVRLRVLRQELNRGRRARRSRAGEGRLVMAARPVRVRSSACTSGRCRKGNCRFERASCLKDQSR
jgi:hypothetical protein